VPAPSPRRRPLPARAVLLIVAVLALGVPASASAARTLSVGIADDATVLWDQDNAPAIAARWKASGIETVRLDVRWAFVAPDPLATTPPLGFDAADPGDPRYDWHRIDRAVRIIRDTGLQPMLTITGSGPLWASRFPDLGNPRYLPDPGAFGRFAGAVARRYARDVRHYLVWNEPNEPLWLQPQQECASLGHCRPVAPHVYRDLLRAAYPAIHAGDADAEVIGGSLAPRGIPPVKRNSPLRPLAFLRAFGCVDRRLNRTRTGRCRGFRPATMDGFSYHPHPVTKSPTTPAKQPDDAAIGDLRKLERTLDGVQRAHGLVTPSGTPVPLHFTEFGYQTEPPDEHDGISLAKQSRWLQESAYISWRDPRVKTLIEYEWKDEPVRNLGEGQRAYAGWQSGLLFNDGRPKPAYFGFLHPFFADTTVAAPKVRFWGQVRPGTAHVVLLQRGSSARGPWLTVRRARTDTRGAFAVTLAVPSRAGWYRYRTAGLVATEVVARPTAPQVSDVLRVKPVAPAARPAKAKAPAKGRTRR
jgi:hypothetical protein